MSAEAIDQSVFEEEIIEEAIYVPKKPGDRYWRDDALCINADADDFNPPRISKSRKSEISRVEQNIISNNCLRCDVQQPCLDDALVRREEEGVLGGTTRNNRRRLLRILKVTGGSLTEKDFKGTMVPFRSNATREAQPEEA